jgi:hypothetical protein
MALLAALGLRALVAGPPAAPAPVRTVVRGGEDITAQGFAQAFVRAYLSWDGRQREEHERQVAPFLAGALPPDGGLRPPDGERQEVLWTAAIQDRPTGPGARTVTVAAQTSRQLLYVAVPVQRTRRGFLLVPRYPALVGPLVSEPSAAVGPEEPVQDPAVRDVAVRAVTNYLEGQRDDLLADLDPRAVVSLPARPIRLSSVQEVSWARPGRRVAVEVTAGDMDGVEWTLRYELDMVRHDRWYVRTVQTDPTAREVVHP